MGNQKTSIEGQYVAKRIVTCKKIPYIINQDHIFQRNIVVISGYILTNFKPKHSELFIF